MGGNQNRAYPLIRINNLQLYFATAFPLPGVLPNEDQPKNEQPVTQPC